MKTRAAVLRKAGTPWEITELELDPPKANEVLIQMEAAGLCHSDEHIRSRGIARLPLVGGHEGSGIVMETGPGVTAEHRSRVLAHLHLPGAGLHHGANHVSQGTYRTFLGRVGSVGGVCRWVWQQRRARGFRCWS